MEFLKLIAAGVIGLLWFYFIFRPQIEDAFKPKKELNPVEKALTVCAMGNTAAYGQLKFVYDGIMIKGFADKMDVMQFLSQGIPILTEIKKIDRSNALMVHRCLHKGGRIYASVFQDAILNIIQPGGEFEGLDKIYLK